MKEKPVRRAPLPGTAQQFRGEGFRKRPVKIRVKDFITKKDNQPAVVVWEPLEGVNTLPAYLRRMPLTKYYEYVERGLLTPL